MTLTMYFTFRLRNRNCVYRKMRALDALRLRGLMQITCLTELLFFRKVENNVVICQRHLLYKGKL